ncbi:winged helix-turn-helix domain-containing protein [Rufibacter aurantiacus]|uniref:winged helix-turn-helix domain-containing protein n=1 Tax=Rufibacter aurantiacus TaxID=2817374 RepID=UPI001B317F4D|nr:winged helix-turn-helix domain-containing protein [Rufibacter aurantiacus]
MEQKDFLLQGRYLVRPNINSVSDTFSQNEVRIEPRLMKILCMLASHANQLVTREQLVKEVWDNYGGGEEGLTYAISSLRKLLHDTSKELIETIPKKGYMLHAQIQEAGQQEQVTKTERKARPLKPVLYGLVCLVLVMGIYLVRALPSKENAAKEEQIAQGKQMEVPFATVNRPIEETPYNTITTLGNDSTRYKLKVEGDRRPEFYINGSLLTPEEMEGHLDLIHHLRKELKRRNAIGLKN